jgi:anti-anti-sigma factor
MSARSDAQNPLAALITEQCEAIVERLAREASAPGRTTWSAIPMERLKAAILVTLQAILRDLEAGTHHHYPQHLVSIATPRVRGGFTARDARVALDDLSRALRDMCQKLPTPAEQIQALEQVSLIIEAAWATVFENFSDALRAAVEDAHLAVLQKLSSPIIPIHVGILVLPLIGPIDASRGELIMETLLSAITREHAFGVLLDITGVPAIDAAAAGWLVRVAQASRLLGAEVILVGVSPEIAQTMVTAQLDLRGLVTLGTLKAGLEHALARRGLVIQPRSSAPAIAGARVREAL